MNKGISELKRAVVITSINKPTESVKLFATEETSQVIVIGDKKTPENYSFPNVNFYPWGGDGLPSVTQKLSGLLPHNHYSRKNLGYMVAGMEGFDVILDTDDDNLPIRKIPDLPLRFEGKGIEDRLGFINTYSLFTGEWIWPRGLPLSVVAKGPKDPPEFIENGSATIPVWQGLADGDPDVDSIYRLTRPDTLFKFKSPDLTFYLGAGNASPFNSQNTIFHKPAFPLLYLPSFVSFRYTDILRSFVAQPILWKFGYRVGFFGATVFQDRNEHNLANDFDEEIIMYKLGEQPVQWVTKAISPASNILEAITLAYRELVSRDVVGQRELPLLDSWIEFWEQF